jgi:hypothetical protein
LVIAVIVVLAVVLLGTNLARIIEFQVDYFRRIEELSHG